MSEISSTRPWTHVHFDSGETEYFLDIYRGNIEPDTWDFGTNKQMWEQVIDTIKSHLQDCK